MKPRVIMNGDNRVEVILPAPHEVPNKQRQRLIRAWQDSYLSLSTESLVCMFANECGALIQDVKVSPKYCTFVFLFRTNNCAQHFYSLIVQL